MKKEGIIFKTQGPKLLKIAKRSAIINGTIRPRISGCPELVSSSCCLELSYLTLKSEWEVHYGHKSIISLQTKYCEHLRKFGSSMQRCQRHGCEGASCSGESGKSAL